MKVPYPIKAAVSTEVRHGYMAHAVGLRFPRLGITKPDDGASISVACYGPSLADTWQDIKPPICTVSGALKYLTERGVKVDYHIDMDPRGHKVAFIDPPVAGVHYVMASVCHPNTWKVLRGQTVTMWHAVSSKTETLPWVERNDPGQLVVLTGSNVGLAAIQVMGLAGYRHFEIHGMDGCHRDGVRHAGAHGGINQKDMLGWNVFGEQFKTSRIMANGVAEVLNHFETINSPIVCVFHGRGLQQQLIRKRNFDNACCADETDKAERLRKAKPEYYIAGPVEDEFWWADLRRAERPAWLEDLQSAWAEAESTRHLAKYNTGSISLETGLLLRALCAEYRPKVVVEIGTFIGKSTRALEASRIYTCDKDNDCVQLNGHIVTHPYTTSTGMLAALVERGVKADLFFFDGRIQPQDAPLILRLSNPGTAYVFDDFKGNFKGVVNVNMLMPLLPGYRLVQPYAPWAGRTTLAVLAPPKDVGETLQ